MAHKRRKKERGERGIDQVMGAAPTGRKRREQLGRNLMVLQKIRLPFMVLFFNLLMALKNASCYKILLWMSITPIPSKL